MWMNDLVSIIVPIYNGEMYLEKCILSIINQTYKNLEIILINDGSKDKSLKLCNKLAEKDSRIVVINQENGGVSKARNTGIDNSTGKYITFADADDWLDEDAIEKMVKLIKSNNCDVVRLNNYIDEENYKSKVLDININEKKYTSEEINNEHLDLFLNGKINCYVWLLLIKASVLKKKNIRFIEGLCMMEDKCFYIDLLTNIETIYMSNEPIYHYFMNSQSVTHNVSKYEKNIYSILQVNKYIENQLIFKDYFNKQMLNTNSFTIIVYFICEMLLINKSFEKVILRLLDDEKIKYLIENLSYKYTTISQKIKIKLLLKKHLFLLKVYCKTIKLIKKIKG